MPAQDTSEIKNRIVSLISKKGPSLPVAIARETGINTLFASAFLSELISDKVIKMSNMKVGSSSIYFVPGQETLLENFSNFLKSKEKDAFSLLKNRKVLQDSEQEPAIRVALRAIKDFAIPFKNDGEVYWKYFSVANEDVTNMFEAKMPAAEKKEQAVLKPKEVQAKIAEKPAKKAEKEPVRKKVSGKKAPQSEKFLEKIREFLSKSQVDILSIESMAKDELVLKIRENGEECLLIAFNKKRITEKEIVKASKRASQTGLRYSVVSFGKVPKKTLEILEALKSMNRVDEVK